MGSFGICDGNTFHRLGAAAKKARSPNVFFVKILGSEVTLCHEHLQKKLGVSGPRLNFTLSGMTGSTRVESQLLDIVVTSIDDTVQGCCLRKILGSPLGSQNKSREPEPQF